MARIRLAATVLAMVATAWTVLDACGDKFLLVGRGASFQRAYASVYPGSIIVYLSASPRTAERSEGLQKVLTRAGHRVTLVTDGAALADMLARRQADIVIAPIDEASALQARLGASMTPPSIVLVTDDTRKSAERSSIPDATVLKASDKALKVLKVIEDAMKARVDAGTRVKRG